MGGAVKFKASSLGPLAVYEFSILKLVREGMAIGGCNGAACLIYNDNPAGSNFCSRGAQSNVWYFVTVLEAHCISTESWTKVNAMHMSVSSEAVYRTHCTIFTVQWAKSFRA